MKANILQLIVIFSLLIFVSCEEEPIIPVGQTNYIEAELPGVETGFASNISQNSLEIEGEIIKLGNRDILHYGHCYSPGGIPDTTDSKTDFGAANTLSTFSSTFESLNSETVYNVRAYAVNEAGIKYGVVIQVQTEAEPATVVIETGETTFLGSETAEVTGEVLDVGDGFISQYGHCWDIESTPTLSNEFADLGSTSQTGEFTSQLDNLNPATTYYVRGYAISDADTVYGEQITIFTNPSK